MILCFLTTFYFCLLKEFFQTWNFYHILPFTFIKRKTYAKQIGLGVSNTTSHSKSNAYESLFDSDLIICFILQKVVSETPVMHHFLKESIKELKAISPQLALQCVELAVFTPLLFKYLVPPGSKSNPLMSLRFSSKSLIPILQMLMLGLMFCL